MGDSTRPKLAAKARRKRSAKPRKRFPLFQHRTGRWCKKVLGKHRYFGSVKSDPDGVAALERWLAEKDFLLNGVAPPTITEGPAVADVCNLFLADVERLVEAGERAPRTFADYKVVCRRIVKVFCRTRPAVELTPDDFARLRAAFARTRGPFALSGDIARVKAIFSWAVKFRHLPTLPDYGGGFEKPNLRTLRIARAKGGARMFEREQVLAMLNGATVDGQHVDGAAQPLRSMILLAINAGLGNADVGRLAKANVNLKTGWLDFPRPKTGIARRVPLWPETIDSLRDWLDARPAGKNADIDALMFVTAKGLSWHKDVDDNPVAKQTSKLLKRLGLHSRGLSFYSLRRTFRTIASESRDEAAADAIMGHAPNANDMAAIYRQRVDDDRLRAVVDHVRRWLFPKVKIG